MNAFETVIGQYLEDQGYWVRHSVKVEITKDDKKLIGLPSMPRPEIDLIAYSPGKREMLLIEAKSFLDSPGVRLKDVSGQNVNGHYKLFTNQKFRDIVSTRLVDDYLQKDLIVIGSQVKYVLAAGKIYANSEPLIKALFNENGWILIPPGDIKNGIKEMAKKGYEDNLITVTTKLILK